MNRIGEIDVALVLGSGLSQLVSRREFIERIPYAEIDMPVAALEGHGSEALVGTWHDKRVLAFTGRIHGYQGFSARDLVRNVAIAADHGAKVLVVTNAAGALAADLRPGDLMILADHINLTGLNPLVGSDLPDPFVAMTQAYSPRLRAFARNAGAQAREGVYAAVLGPTFETPAEARYLRTIGADAVGMSTVLETIAARARGMEVFGVSLIANSASAAGVSHEAVLATAKSATPHLASMLDAVLSQA